jgi:hypothetical protein
MIFVLIEPQLCVTCLVSEGSHITLKSLRKCKTVFIQGTPVDCLSIHLFLGQANVSRLGVTLVKKTHLYQDWVM